MLIEYARRFIWFHACDTVDSTTSEFHPSISGDKWVKLSRNIRLSSNFASLSDSPEYMTSSRLQESVGVQWAGSRQDKLSQSAEVGWPWATRDDRLRRLLYLVVCNQRRTREMWSRPRPTVLSNGLQLCSIGGLGKRRQEPIAAYNSSSYNLSSKTPLPAVWA